MLLTMSTSPGYIPEDCEWDMVTEESNRSQNSGNKAVDLERLHAKSASDSDD
jgi:hypothetical protein